MTQALTATRVLPQDKQYIIGEGKVVIVDEFTGRAHARPRVARRAAPGRRGQGRPRGHSRRRTPTPAISFQRFFRLYSKLAGMTGTAPEGWREFWQIYHLPVVVIPTNRPCIRTVAAGPRLCHRGGQVAGRRRGDPPASTRAAGRSSSARAACAPASTSAACSPPRAWSTRCSTPSATPRRPRSSPGPASRAKITVATNMAGRGTDIKLGRGVAELGGLHVIATERHEAGRIDRQLFGRCARQGDPGSAQAIVSLEDEFVCRYAAALASYLRGRHAQESADVSSALAKTAFHLAQYRAERFALSQRKAVMRADHWLDETIGFAGTA